MKRKHIPFKLVFICLFVLFLSLVTSIKAQFAAAYSFVASTGSYVELSEYSATNLPLVQADSYLSLAQNIGFNFIYEGVSYSQFKMASDGYITFNTGQTISSSGNDLSNTSARPIIAPLWDDLDGRASAVGDPPGTSSKAYYQLTGVAPNRILCVEWRKWEWGYTSTSPVMSFQVKLYETSNKIEFIYRQEAGTIISGAASIGIASAHGQGSGSFLNVTSISAPAVSSTLAQNNLNTKPLSGTVYTFTPPPPCSGIPTGGVTTTYTPVICTSGMASLALSGSSDGSQQTYQWQSSPTGTNNFSNINGANFITYSGNISASTDFRVLVTCTNSGLSTTSIPVTVTVETAPPVNDLVCDAIPLNLNEAPHCGNTTCATNNADPFYAIHNTPKNSVWYKYTPSVSGTAQIIMSRPSNLTSGFLYAYINIYTSNGNCPLPVMTEISSTLIADLVTNTTVSNITPTLTAGVTYYIMIHPYATFDNGGYCVQLAPPPPPNDDCSNAVSISGYTGSVNGNTLAATQSRNAETCVGISTTDGSPAKDVWYSFRALNTGNGTITLNNVLGFDPVMMMYSGTCNNLVNIACANLNGIAATETLNFTGLVTGQTYYLRVYGYTAATGTFQISASGAALPVSVSSFKGERQNAINRLEWTTATEINNNGFELQRSADGVNFSTLSFIASKASNGNSTSVINYSFGDVKPFAGTNYYRLKQIDKDGKLTLSDIVTIKGAKVSELVLSSIYPNPVEDKLSVVITAPANDKITLVITDLAGKMIMQKATQVNAGDNNIELPVASFGKGVYVIKAMCSNGCETALQRFIKQ